MGFFEEVTESNRAVARLIEAFGGVYSDPFNEIATVVSVSDPKKLGRVKVSYQDGSTSDWVYVLNGSNKGLLSAQFIGASCLIGKSDGNSEDAFVLGFFNKSPDAGYPGSASQIAVVSEQLDVNRTPASPGDQGLRCNEGNEGRQYLFDNEMGGQVLRICKRVNSRQEGGEPIWNWENQTIEKVIEKAMDPGVPIAEGTSNYGDKTGIPECSKALEGQIREFAEDRKFRSFQIKCGKDENGKYVWSPVSSAPVFFRTTLPDCTEKLHGMDAILDEGLNSQGIKCLRYQGSMKWINPGKREPIQFHRQDPPPTREEFIDSRKPIKALGEQNASASSQDFVGNAIRPVLDAFGKAISPINSDPALRAAMVTANALPAAFNGTNVLTDVALIAIANNANISPAALSSQLATALANGNVIDSELAQVLSVLGGAGDVIARGVRNSTLDEAFKIVGQNALRQSIGALSPELSAMYSAYGAGGALGAIDAAMALGLTQVPQEIAQYISPIVDIGIDVLRSQPSAINGMLNASIGRGSQSLQQIAGGLVSAMGAQGSIPPEIASVVSGVLSSGELGPIAQMFGNFSGLPGIPALGGVNGLPQLATTALGLVGLGTQFTSFLGPAGIGLNAFSALTGINPVSSILGGIPGIGGLFGGGGAECPCDPKCRKIKHSEDSDGNTLLEKCGNVIANSASSYNPDGDPTKNNENVVAELIDRIPTAIGEKLCISNPYDLTQLIKNVKRLDEMADRIDSAKHADWPELWTELMYTFEAIEKAFKQTDNNITGVESVERKLIDAQFRLITKLMDGNGSFFSKALISIVDTSKAIQDVYNFVRRLDGVKKGGRAGVFATESLKIVFENITKIAALNSVSKKEARNILSNIVQPADKEWRKLEPGGDLLDISSVILGLIPKDVPLNFDKCLTKRDKDKVLKDSIESKVNSPTLPEPSSLFDSKLSENARNRLRNLPAISDGTLTPDEAQSLGILGTLPPQRPGVSTLLDQIRYEQGRAESGETEC